jgi:hypothetical protein
MSKITNTVVYFDWKTVIYIYVCGKCHTPFMLPMEKSVIFTGTCLPTRNNNCLWLFDFRGEDFLEINQSAIRIAHGGHVC